MQQISGRSMEQQRADQQRGKMQETEFTETIIVPEDSKRKEKVKFVSEITRQIGMQLQIGKQCVKIISMEVSAYRICFVKLRST